jgi:hypothetical protein
MSESATTSVGSWCTCAELVLAETASENNPTTFNKVFMDSIDLIQYERERSGSRRAQTLLRHLSPSTIARALPHVAKRGGTLPPDMRVASGVDLLRAP